MSKYTMVWSRGGGRGAWSPALGSGSHAHHPLCAEELPTRAAPPPPLLYNTRCARAAEEVLAKECGQTGLHRQAE